MKKLNKFALLFCFSALSLNVFAQTPVNRSQKANTAVSNVIIFGDSLSDAGSALTHNSPGNNYWVHTQGKHGAPITNEDEHGLSPMWDNQLVGLLFPGKVLYRSSDLTTPTNLNPAKDNISYAWASARSGEDYLNDEITGDPPVHDSSCLNPGQIDSKHACVPGSQKQAEFYFKDLKSRQLSLNRNTVFIIWIGSNDILYCVTHSACPLASLPPSTHSSAKASKTDLTVAKKVNNISNLDFHFLVSNIVDEKNYLIKQGVAPSKIYILDIPDLTRFPVLPIIVPASNSLSVLRKKIQNFNSTLKDSLVHGENPLPSSHVISMWNLFNEIREHPKKYGLTNVKDSCVTEHKTPTCKGYFFYNFNHPSTYVGTFVAKAVKTTVTLSESIRR